MISASIQVRPAYLQKAASSISILSIGMHDPMALVETRGGKSTRVLFKMCRKIKT
jgi:hypothetical protein